MTQHLFLMHINMEEAEAKKERGGNMRGNMEGGREEMKFIKWTF